IPVSLEHVGRYRQEPRVRQARRADDRIPARHRRGWRSEAALLGPLSLVNRAPDRRKDQALRNAVGAASAPSARRYWRSNAASWLSSSEYGPASHARELTPL